MKRPFLFDLPFLPPSASTFAERVNRLFLFLAATSAVVVALVFVSLGLMAVRYRQGSRATRAGAKSSSLPLELVWSLVPLGFFLYTFARGADIYQDETQPPADALPIYVVGKQWMWKVQHPEGKRELNELHVPLRQPIQLLLTSEDVIHDFYVPAFRVKQDVLPGRYSRLWFEATEAGTFRFYCAQYCGTAHATMLGQVVVMAPARFEEWLAGGPGGEPMAKTGARLYTRFNCHTCHAPGGRGPLLGGVAASRVRLADGSEVVADEAYLRESILNPAAKLVAGFAPVMPTYQGQLSESEVLELIAYLKSLSASEQAEAGR